MKIILDSLTSPNPAQAQTQSKAKKFRKEFSKRIENGTISSKNISNLCGLTERFANEGLQFKQILKASKRNPFLLVQKPETIERSIRGTAKIFKKHGLTSESYLLSALSYPNLFLITPKTVEKNITEIATTFAPEGLTTKELIEMAQKFPTLYTQKAKTLNKNVTKIAKAIGVEKSEIIKLMKKHPTVCGILPKNFIKKFEFLKYIEQNKLFDAGKEIPADEKMTRAILKKSFTNSMELNYLTLLRNKISTTLPWGCKLPFDRLESSIKEFLQRNPNTIEFTLPKSKCTSEFIKFAKNFSKSAIGKNIFKIKIA